MSVAGVRAFFANAREREEIRLRKRGGEPPPWSRDRVFQETYLCNVNREHDKVTTWFRENVRDPLRDTCRVPLVTVAFRWFNHIPTGEQILESLLRSQNLVVSLEVALRPLQQRKEQLFTSAFIVKSPNGMDKLTGVLSCLGKAGWILADGPGDDTLAAYHALLMRVPYLGPFMAYQVVCDLRHTAVLENAPDINTWACPGPGSARGLQRVFGGPLLSYGSASGRKTLVEMMTELLAWSRAEEFWPKRWWPWELSTVQHWACEHDKIERVRAGGKSKRWYRNGGGR